jgi:hypothetical protein
MYRLVVVGIMLTVLMGCNKGFTNAQIDEVKHSIKTEYEKNGATVTEVFMMRESPKKLVGFVKINVSFGIWDSRTVTQSCNATMGEDSYMWRCE